MPLSDTSIRTAKPKSSTRRLFDERGLYLEIAPAGGKWWRFKYRFEGKEKRLSLGVYPDITLKMARERRDAARQQVATGVDPSASRKAKRSSSARVEAESFEAVAREWFARFSPKWAEAHRSRILSRLERDIFPDLGPLPLSGITLPALLQVLRRVEVRSIETAHRALRNVGQIMRYGMATGRCTYDITPALRGALPPVPVNHFAATTEPKRLGAILRQMDAYPGGHVVSAALKLAPLLFVRPGELRKAEWSQFDLDRAEWAYVTSKTGTPHLVPLSTQAVAVLRWLWPITGSGGDARYVLPSARSRQRPMSDAAVLVALRSMDISQDEMTGHGFRAVARTLLDEELKFRPDIIELQLAHAVKDPNGRAYNRTTHLEERRRMMQAWADYLDKLKASI